MNIYITRHGQTQWNKEGRMQGCQNSDLTESGVYNAKKLGESLKHMNFDVIYCSPLGRAVDTAKHIRGNKDTEIVINEALKEMNFGVWEGMTYPEIKEIYPQQYENFWNKPQLFEAINGESFDELIHRVKNGLNELISKESYENILIVTHTCVIKAISLIVKDHSIEGFWDLPYINDTSLTVLEVIDKKMKFILEADVSHLD